MSEVMLSTKGQIVLPKRMREARGWHAGTALVVQEVPQGLLLKEAKAALFPPSRVEDLDGLFEYTGPRLDDDDHARAIDRMHAEAYGKAP